MQDILDMTHRSRKTEAPPSAKKISRKSLPGMQSNWGSSHSTT